MSLDLAQRLHHIECIKQLKARYCRFIDTKQWDSLRALFTEDCRFEGFGSAPPRSTPDMFVSGVSSRLNDAISIHQCHTPEIEVSDEGSARGAWAMMDYLEWPLGTSPVEAPESRGFFGFGYYEEEYRCEQGEWKFSFLRLTRIRIDPLPRATL